MPNEYGYEHALQVPEIKYKQEQTEANNWVALAKENIFD